MVERLLIALPSQQQLVDRLQHLIYLSSSLIFVSGEEGAGKSILMELLSNQLPDTVQEAFVNYIEDVSDAQIRQQIIMQLFEQPLFDAHESLVSSFAQLQEKFNLDTPQLIIIDNAQYISDLLLAELIQLVTHNAQVNEHEINILLLGDENTNKAQIIKTNQYLQGNDSHCACLEFKVEPLTHEESVALLEHVFEQNAYQSKLQHQDAVTKQLNACAGNAHNIITLAEQIIDGKLENDDISNFRARLPALLLMVALLLITTLLAIYLKPTLMKMMSSEEPAEIIVEAETFVIEDIEATEIIAGDSSEAQTTATSESLAGKWPNSPDSDISENKLKVGISDETVPRVIISEKQILESLNGGTELTIELRSPLTSQAVATEYVSLKESGERQAEQKETVSDSSNIAQKSEILTIEKAVVIENSVSDEVAIKESETVKLKQETTSNLQSKPQADKVPSDKDTPPLFTPTEKLLATPASHYTLQLAAMNSEKSLQRFVRLHNLPRANVFIYETIHNNQPRYIIMYGAYDSRASAKNASKKLPGTLKNIKTWIKKYSFVHQDLKLNNE